MPHILPFYWIELCRYPVTSYFFCVFNTYTTQVSHLPIFTNWNPRIALFKTFVHPRAHSLSFFSPTYILSSPNSFPNSKKSIILSSNNSPFAFFSFLNNFLILLSLEGFLSPSGTLFRLYRPFDRSTIIFGIYLFFLCLLFLSFIIS